MWIRLLLTATALAVVLYFQIFFDFSQYTESKTVATKTEKTEAEF